MKQAKRQPVREKAPRIKRKNTYSKLRVLLQKGGVMMMAM
jgi:hypothetical protein